MDNDNTQLGLSEESTQLEPAAPRDIIAERLAARTKQQPQQQPRREEPPAETVVEDKKADPASAPEKPKSPIDFSFRKPQAENQPVEKTSELSPILAASTAQAQADAPEAQSEQPNRDQSNRERRDRPEREPRDRNKPDRRGRERAPDGERQPRPERSETPGLEFKPQSTRPERDRHNQRAERTDRPDRAERTDRPDRNERPARPEIG